MLVTVALATPAGAAEFSSPNGQTGAGLSTDAKEKIRIYGEGTFYLRTGTRESAFFGDYDVTEWALPIMLGGGYRVLPELEIEARLPIAIGRLSVEGDGAGSFTPGNLYAGANYLWQKSPWLLKVGGGLAFGPWTFDPSTDRSIAYALSAVTNLEDFYMFPPETFVIVSPNRLEYRFKPELVFTGDLSLALYIPVDGGDAELVSTLAPGAAYQTGPWTLGGRLPLFWAMTDDDAQFAIEPYGRYDFGSAYAAARFTLNLDEPYGFSFSEAKVWAFHFGVGATF